MYLVCTTGWQRSSAIPVKWHLNFHSKLKYFFHNTSFLENRKRILWSNFILCQVCNPEKIIPWYIKMGFFRVKLSNGIAEFDHFYDLIILIFYSICFFPFLSCDDYILVSTRKILSLLKINLPLFCLYLIRLLRTGDKPPTIHVNLKSSIPLKIINTHWESIG